MPNYNVIYELKNRYMSEPDVCKGIAFAPTKQDAIRTIKNNFEDMGISCKILSIKRIHE